MEFLTSRKGKRQITLNGYIFNKQKLLANNTISWECTERRNARLCMARIKTVDDQVVGRLNQYTHLPRPEAVHENMKDRAITTMEKTRDIISGAAAEQNDQVLANLPSARTLQRDIQRQRQKANNLPRVPDINDFAFLTARVFHFDNR